MDQEQKGWNDPIVSDEEFLGSEEEEDADEEAKEELGNDDGDEGQ